MAFTLGPPRDLTEALSQAVLALATGTEMVLNLHSAGPARYLPHVMFYRPEDGVGGFAGSALRHHAPLS